jgi:hypothetical protein
MNIDNGHITLWRELTDEQKESGRWIKLGEGELAAAATMDQAERRANLDKIFREDMAALKKQFADEHPIYGKPRR